MNEVLKKVDELKQMKEQTLILNSVSSINYSINIVYRKFADGEYIGAVGDYALLVYKLKNNNIVGINLGFKRKNDTIYKCDTEIVINLLYYYEVGEELLEKYDIEYASKKMEKCDAEVFFGKTFDFSDKNLDYVTQLYKDTKRLNEIIKSHYTYIEQKQKESKEELRNKLFAKYFKVEEGVKVTELVDKLSFIPEVWNELHNLCKNNFENFDEYSVIEDIKLLNHNDKNYLILKLPIYRYIIIDIERKENITEEQFENNFDKDFFASNFNARKRGDNDSLEFYCFEKYYGNIEELLAFYMENEQTLNLSKKIDYILKADNAWIYFHIDFVNEKGQFGFDAKNQFPYEHLDLRYDLRASKMQDVKNKVGIENMQEISQKIKEIKISQKVIPTDLYKEYLIKCKEESKILKKM